MSKKDFCPVAGKCGGCQLTNMDYQRQLKFKQARVVKLFGRQVRVSEIIPSPNIYGYRNKVSAAFGKTRSGKVISGIYKSSVHTIVDIKYCNIENRNADEIINSIKKIVTEMNIPVYDEKRQKGFIRHVTVRVAENTGEYLVTIVTGEEYFPKKEEFLSVLLKAHPEITTVVQNINNKFGSMVMGDKEKILYGDGYITDILCGKKFRISSGSFYQINKGQCENLYSYVLKNSGIKKSDTVIDAYCGTGTIGIICSDIAKKVTGCELNSKACEDAIVNAKLNGVENIEFENDDAGRFMKKLSRENRPADVVITDPPRQGCSIEFLKAVVEMSPREIVYISCEPKTQARDTNFLTKNGYKIKKCTPFDMFPYTNHVETVVLLSKGEIDSKKIRVEFSLEDMDTSGFQQGATYEQIKGRVLEQTGLKVSSLYISQIKRKCGLEVGQSYNLSKKENAKQPQCPPEKEKAIREAMKYFGMI